MRLGGIDRFNDPGIDVTADYTPAMLCILHCKRQPYLTQANYCHCGQTTLYHQACTSIDIGALWLFASRWRVASASWSTTFKTAIPSSPVTVGAVSFRIAAITSSYS